MSPTPPIGEELIIPFLIGELGESSATPTGTRPATPHFAFPFGRGPNGKVSLVEQDSPEHVLSCCQMIARCPIGARPERPEFGWRWPYMRMLPLDTSLLTDALKRFEPRSEPLSQDGTQALAQIAVGIEEIDVNIGTTNADPTGVGRGVND